MIRVRAYSRLHFGFLSCANVTRESDPHGAAPPSLPVRQFGGVGMMIREPGLSLSIRPAADWSAEGPAAARALDFARRLAASLEPKSVQPQQILIERCAAEHAGLGTGTQLGLAVARGLAAAWGLLDLHDVELAQRVGRGRRSALGIHGFELGGFLVEGGKRSPETVAPLIARVDFPEPWRLVLVVPPWGSGLHGPAEAQAFQRLNPRNVPAVQSGALCRLVLLGLLPALHERDFEAFGEALYDFNRLAGEVFALVQGSVYAGPRLEELATFIRQQDIRGVAQSSWGPAMAAAAPDEERAAHLVRLIRERFALGEGEVFSTGACNHGAQLEAG